MTCAAMTASRGSFVTAALAVPGFRVVYRIDAPPLTAAAVVGTTGVFQHAQQVLAVVAVDADTAVRPALAPCQMLCSSTAIFFL
jgi:hypothetical protein